MRDLTTLIKFIFPFWKNYWKQELIIGLVLILLLICQLAIPIQLKNTIDAIFEFKTSNVFIWSLFILCFLMIASSGLTWIFQVIAAWVGESLIIQITSNTYNFILQQRRSFWQRFYPEDVLTRLTQDILAAKSFSIDLFHTVILNSVSMIASVAVLIYFSLKVGLLILLFIPIIFTLAYWGDRYLNHNAMKVRILASKFTGIFRAGIWSPHLNYSWNLSHFHNNNYQHLANNMKQAQVGFINQTQIIGQSITLVNIFVATIGVLYLLYSDYQTGLYTTGQVFAVIMYSGKATQNATELAGIFATSKIDRVAILRILELLSFKPPSSNIIDPAKDKITHPFFNGKLGNGIKLPQKEKFLLKIDAENGTGKTTLSQFLSGFDDLSNSLVNEQWFLIPSDPPIFSDSLLDNIRVISNKNITSDDLQYTLSIHSLSNLLSLFPNGPETPILNNAEMISRGQKQVITLIAAIVKDPPMIFIDEGLNSLSYNLRESIREPLSKWLKQRKVIIVDHNDYFEFDSLIYTGDIEHSV